MTHAGELRCFLDFKVAQIGGDILGIGKEGLSSIAYGHKIKPPLTLKSVWGWLFLQALFYFVDCVALVEMLDSLGKIAAARTSVRKGSGA